MNALVATNIKKTIENLNSIKASLDFRVSGLYPNPVFYGTKDKILSTQSDFFGFYVLSNAIRSILRGVNFIIASQHVLESKLLAPSIALSYTAGFHGLMAHLALEGRSFFEDGSYAWAEKDSNGKLTVVKPLPDMPLIAAILKKNNKWIFECRRRSHSACWRELLQLFANPSYIVPQYYYDLFEYLFRGRQKKEELGVKGLKEVLENPALREANKLHLEDAKEEFLKRIADIRHIAIYGAFGGDPHVVEAIWSGDTASSRGIERQAIKFYSFSKAMHVHISTEIINLLSCLKPIASVKRALRTCTNIWWFDIPLIDEIPNKLLKSKVKQIKKWIYGR